MADEYKVGDDVLCPICGETLNDDWMCPNGHPVELADLPPDVQAFVTASTPTGERGGTTPTAGVFTTIAPDARDRALADALAQNAALTVALEAIAAYADDCIQYYRQPTTTGNRARDLIEWRQVHQMALNATRIDASGSAPAQADSDEDGGEP